MFEINRQNKKGVSIKSRYLHHPIVLVGIGVYLRYYD